MSVWTHVAGIIRIDSLMPAMCHDESWVNTIPDTMLANVPEGSEGPLRVTVHVTAAERSSIARGYIAIDGDLRHFDNPQIVQRWLNTIKMSEGCFIRQGVVLVDVEYLKDSVIYVYIGGDRPDHGKWIEANNKEGVDV